MQTEIKEALKESYNKHAQEREKSEMQEWKVKPRFNFLELLKDEGKRNLLDLGAGHGRDSLFFKENGLEVTAVDMSEEMVKLCREKGITAYELDFYNLDRIKRTFDSVWALNSLLHVCKADLPLVLQQIKDILEPSGLFYMGVYGGENFERIWENDIYTPHRFFSFYTDEALIRVITGFFDIISYESIETGETYNFQSIIMRNK